LLGPLGDDEVVLERAIGVSDALFLNRSHIRREKFLQTYAVKYDERYVRD
jgi:hypothetical protein